MSGTLVDANAISTHENKLLNKSIIAIIIQSIMYLYVWVKWYLLLKTLLVCFVVRERYNGNVAGKDKIHL